MKNKKNFKWDSSSNNASEINAKKSLIDHISNEQLDKGKRKILYFCNHCILQSSEVKSFPQKYNLVRHLKAKHSNGQEKLVQIYNANANKIKTEVKKKFLAGEKECTGMVEKPKSLYNQTVQKIKEQTYEANVEKVVKKLELAKSNKFMRECNKK